MTEQDGQCSFADPEFAWNPYPRCLCLLLLDTSASMAGRPIDELNEGLVIFKQELMADYVASKSVDLAIVTFGPVRTETKFCSVALFQPPTLIANGNAPVGAAIHRGLEMLRKRKAKLNEEGIPLFLPWVFLMTYGAPTGNWQNTAAIADAPFRRGQLPQ